LRARPEDGREDTPSAERALVEQVDALTAKVAGARESALLAPPSERVAVWELVSKWSGELEDAKAKLALLRAASN
jgi:hypothetical protein